MCCWYYTSKRSFPGGSEVKNNTEDSGSIPGLGRTPEEGNVNQLQYACLENSMDREPSGLESMGSQRVGHDWVTTHTHTHKALRIWVYV